jgi:hypothetical protein
MGQRKKEPGGGCRQLNSIFAEELSVMDRYFIPFTQVKNQPALIVDSMHPNGLVLSHWRGAPTPASVRGDTSADIVFNALHQHLPGLDCPAVTANHFDIDGFIGVWALLNPELALAHEAALREAARIGDFRELKEQNPASALALKLVCWINARELEHFYAPFGTVDMAENEVVASVPKFAYFLREFGAIVQDPEAARQVWEPEYQQVRQDYALIHSSRTHISTYPGIGLVVVRTPQPVHYYALFSCSAGYDMVLALYDGNRYELEYKYTTWIDLDSRPTLPRLALKPLVALLNQKETTGQRWTGEPVTDTGPILRLGGGKTLTKKERYANPTERPIWVSSIPAEELEPLICGYFREAYVGVQPKKYWSWAEVKKCSQRLSG